MKFTKLAAALMCSVVLLCGCSKDSDVAIKVNDSVITKKEFYGDYKKIEKMQLKNFANNGQGVNTKYFALMLKENFVNDIITRTLLKEEFEKRKIEATEQEVLAKKDSLIQKLGEREFQKALRTNGISQKRLMEDLSNEVKMDKLASEIIKNKVTEKDAKAYYDANKEQFKIPETVQAYHILLSTDEAKIKRTIADNDKEAKLTTADIDKKVKEELASKEKIAKELQAQLAKNPKDFQKIAKEKSDDIGSAKEGGNLGLITRDSVVKEFGDMAFSQKVNTVSPVVKSQFGYHIIYVTQKNKATEKSFDEIKDELISFLDMQTKKVEFEKLVQDLKSKAKIEYVDESLNPENIRRELQELIKNNTKTEENNNK